MPSCELSYIEAVISMNIRDFKPSDLEFCVELFIDVFNREPWNDQWTNDRAKQYLMDFVSTPGFIGVVAANDSGIHGFIFGVSKCWWKGNEFFIHELCVRSDFHRTGTGTNMLQYLEQTLTTEGIEDIVLLTNRDIPAEKFYVMNGFKEVNRIVFLAKNLNG